MADPNVTALQQTVNRYAAVAGFAPLTFTGMGPLTFDATQRALGYVAIIEPGSGINEEVATQASYLAAAMKSQATLTANAQAVTTFLASAATKLNLTPAVGPVGPPVVASGGAVVPAPLSPFGPGSSSLVTSISAAWKSMPTWGKVLSGTLAGLGLIWGAGRIAKRKSAPSGS